MTPNEALAPLNVAAFSAQTPRLNTEIAVAGYSYEGVLDSHSVTDETLSDLRGLRGEEYLNRMALTALAGDAGGPILDPTGGVLGMLLPALSTGPQLPADVAFSLDHETVQAALRDAGKSSQTANSSEQMAAEDISAAARSMTVLISCWR